MSLRPSGHAEDDLFKPSARAVCDKCGFLWNDSTLQFQWAVQGQTMVNTGSRVCRKCLDAPALFQRNTGLPADPVNILNPRPDLTEASMAVVMQTESGALLDDESGIQILAENS